MLFNKKQSGSILLVTLVFTGIFAVASVGIAGMVNFQHKLARQKVNWHNALSIAEAGIEYYRWHLAHDPTDLQDGTSIEGPYLHNYNDPFGSTIGQFSLNISAPDVCSSNVSITSTGWTTEMPSTKRSVKITYGKKSLADYAFLTNTDAWFGNTETIHGPVHSNGGIRQDGTNDSTVSSYLETYTCQSYHGCSSGGEEKPGVWGSGSDNTLWEYPSSNIDFEALTVDMSALQDIADNQNLYFGNLGLGYHINFLADGTFDLYRIDQLENPVWGYDMDDWIRERWDIKRESFLDNYAIPSSCAIIFIEDNVWVSGIVNGRVTLVAAKLPDVPSNRRNIIIHDNITYNQTNGNDVLGLIAQNNILVPLYSAPDNLEIDAALLAQYGHVFRYQYESNKIPYNIRDTITVYGSIITNQTWTWSWVNSSGATISGYEHTNTIYDPHLKYNPPPAFPTVDEYSVLQWEETTEK